eukprot:scaffold64129_cov51-Attheya_sp.AAC.1
MLPLLPGIFWGRSTNYLVVSTAQAFENAMRSFGGTTIKQDLWLKGYLVLYLVGYVPLYPSHAGTGSSRERG